MRSRATTPACAFALFGDGLIHEFDPDTDTNAFIGNPITPPAADIEGLAFDGGLLFASSASGVLYAIDPNTGVVISQVNVPEGGLFGLATGANLVPAEPYAIVPQGSVWKYFDRGQNLGTAWREPAYNDAAWSSGPARLGYGGDGEVTTVGYGPSGGNKYPTTYFRHHFNVEDPQAVEALLVEILRDDGAAVYLNGTLVVLDNLDFEAPYGAYSFYAVADAEEHQWFSYAIEPSMLRWRECAGCRNPPGKRRQHGPWFRPSYDGHASAAGRCGHRPVFGRSNRPCRPCDRRDLGWRVWSQFPLRPT